MVSAQVGGVKRLVVRKAELVPQLLSFTPLRARDGFPGATLEVGRKRTIATSKNLFKQEFHSRHGFCKPGAAPWRRRYDGAEGDLR
jgi:hypothetical protein